MCHSNGGYWGVPDNEQSLFFGEVHRAVGKKIRLACSAELRNWGTVHLHQFFSHFFFFYACEGRRIRGTACSLEHCFHLVPCEVFNLFSFFVDETLVFDHLLHSCRDTFYNAFWRFFFSAFYYPKEQFSVQSDEEEKHQRHNGSPSFLQWSVNVISVFLILEVSYYLMIFLKSLEEFQS